MASTNPRVDFSKTIDSSVLKGKSVLVTGGAGGIGLALVTVIAEAGAYVTFCDLKTQEGQSVEKDLKSRGLNVQFVQTDVTSWDSQIAAFKSALSFSPSGTLDIVIPNAGLGGTNWIREMPTDLPEGADPPRPNTKVYEVNLIAVHYTAYLGLYYFRQAPASDTKRQILFVSSLAGYGELPLEVDYQAAKYGVRGIFKSLRKSGDPFGGVRFNLLAPTFIKSPMTEKSLALIASMGIKIGVVGDVTDGAMRCLCDETVNGRAVAICPGDPAGSANYDLCDDLHDHDAGREFWKHVQDGTYGSVEKIIG